MVKNNGVVSVYEAKTGNGVYQQRIEGGVSFTASPVAASGRLYIATEDGDVFVVKAGPQYELIAKNPMGEAMLATPALAGDLLVLRGDKQLVAIAETGSGARRERRGGSAGWCDRNIGNTLLY